jgi:hypothetical protein
MTDQSDCIQIDVKGNSSMMDARRYRGANTDTDHYLIITRIRAKINIKLNLNKKNVLVIM